MIRVNLSRVNNNCKISMKSYKEKVTTIHNMIHNKTGEGSDFLGWVDYANKISSAELKKIVKVAERIQANCDVLVVVGIGGSFLGAKAAIDALNGIVKKSACEIVYLGNTFSPTYTAQVLDYIKDKKIAINVISKSGTTLESAIAFRLVAEVAKKCWGPKKYARYVIATTDARVGALHQMAFAEGFEEFVIPSDIGGRYSVFTPVGLVPMAVAGIDIASFVEGARAGMVEYSNSKLDENEAARSTCEVDMLINNVRRIDADPERNIDADYLIVKGAVFNFREAILPVEFTLRNPAGFPYFEDLDASPNNMVFTKVWGQVSSQVEKTTKVEESAFGEPSVKEYTKTVKEWVITGTSRPDAVYEIGDEKNGITTDEIKKALADRETYLADVKKRRDEYEASKKVTPAANAGVTAAAGGFNF